MARCPRFSALAATVSLGLLTACQAPPPARTLAASPGLAATPSGPAVAAPWLTDAGLGETPTRVRLGPADEQAPDGIDGVLHALTHGEVAARFRLRFEDVNQQGFEERARALTLRTAISYRTRPVAGTTAFVEFEDVSAYDGDSFNSTTNGQLTKPVIADPTGTEVNQAYLEREVGGARVRAGRQDIVHANARFLGNVAWRQNYQTYDAVSIDTPLGDDTSLAYAWIRNANRIFGDDHPMGDARQNSHALLARSKLTERTDVRGYWYLLDFKRQSGLAGLATQTLGARVDHRVPLGDDAQLELVLEGAKQRDTGANPADVDSNYRRAEVTGRRGPWSLTLGQEVLQGSRVGTDRFTTPLATLHAFNGWADLFLATPGTGLVDTFLAGGVQLGEDHEAAVIYHDFTSEATARDYGWEVDAILTGKASETSRYGIKFADYHAQDFGANVRKTWVWWQFGT